MDYLFSTTKCQCCAENHKLFQCSKFRSLSINDRWQIVRKHKLCKRCLNPSYEAQNCPLQINCKKRYCDNRSNHNSLLHATFGASPETQVRAIGRHLNLKNAHHEISFKRQNHLLLCLYSHKVVKFIWILFQ